MLVLTMAAGTAATEQNARHRILEAAFWEFYRQGFQGGSLSGILTAAHSTKGAMFHHFAGKLELGYAVVDEMIGPLLLQRWLNPLEGTRDPLGVLQSTFQRYVREDIASGSHVNGCPLNNLAQEMSPLDAGFRTRLDGLYDQWRGGIATALRNGIAAGTVKIQVSPERTAALVVAGQMGIWGTGKSSQNGQLMLDACEALCDYLDSLKNIPKRR